MNDTTPIVESTISSTTLTVSINNQSNSNSTDKFSSNSITSNSPNSPSSSNSNSSNLFLSSSFSYYNNPQSYNSNRSLQAGSEDELEQNVGELLLNRDNSDRRDNEANGTDTPPSSYEDNLEACTFESVSRNGKGKGKGKGREIVEEEEDFSRLGVNQIELEDQDQDQLEVLIESDDNTISAKERKGKGKQVIHSPEEEDNSLSPSAQTTNESTPYASFPTTPTTSSPPTPVNSSSKSKSTSTPIVKRLKRGFSFTKPGSLLNFKSTSSASSSHSSSATSLSNLSSQLNLHRIDSAVIAAQGGGSGCSAGREGSSSISRGNTPTRSRAGSFGFLGGRSRSGSGSSLLFMNSNSNNVTRSGSNSPNLKSGSGNSWKIKSRETFGKLPGVKRNQTLPTVSTSSLAPPLLSNLNPEYDTTTFNIISARREEFAFPNDRSVIRNGKSRSFSDPVLFSNITSNSGIDSNNEFITAPSTPNLELQQAYLESQLELESLDKHGDQEKMNFDILPREIKIKILNELVLNSCGVDSKEKWSGERGGRRELINVGRVSKSLLSLSLDSQLWSTFSLPPSSPKYKSESFLRLLKYSGRFIKNLNLIGFKELTDQDLINGIKLALEEGDKMGTEIVNLTGCTSLSSVSIINLFKSSTNLQIVNLFALSSINDLTIETLATHSHSLNSLNISRCHSLSLTSLHLLSERLQHLRMSGLVGLNDEILIKLVRRFKGLKTLDISATSITNTFSEIITNSLLKENNQFKSNFIEYPSSRTRNKPRRLPMTKCLLQLEYLNLSNCKSLTHLTFFHLSHCLPELKVLELSGMGKRLTTAPINGSTLAEFLTTVPKLEKLDLEGLDSTVNSDEILQALIPKFLSQSSNLDSVTVGIGGTPSLTNLIISTCTIFSNEVILNLVKGLKGLKVLELDGCNISEEVVKVFVQSLKARRLSSLLLLEEGEELESKSFTSKSRVERSSGVEGRNSSGTTSISILDNRSISKRIYKELKPYRTRTGFNSYWSTPFNYHHHSSFPESTSISLLALEPTSNDSNGGNGGFRECDSNLVVIKSAYNHSEIDKVELIKRKLKLDLEEFERRGSASSGGGGRSGLLDWEGLGKCTIS